MEVLRGWKRGFCLVCQSDEEAQLWSAGVLGIHKPSTLVKTVLFWNGKVLCLRGGGDNRILKIWNCHLRCWKTCQPVAHNTLSTVLNVYLWKNQS